MIIEYSIDGFGERTRYYRMVEHTSQYLFGLDGKPLKTEQKELMYEQGPFGDYDPRDPDIRHEIGPDGLVQAVYSERMKERLDKMFMDRFLFGESEDVKSQVVYLTLPNGRKAWYFRDELERRLKHHDKPNQE